MSSVKSPSGAPDDFIRATEGKATILYPKDAKVFYNPIQQFNRDISIASIRAWTALYGQGRKRKRNQTEGSEPQPFIHILEALAASGLRSIRYAKEIPLVKSIIANDLVDHAVESIQRNAEFNGVDSIVHPTQGDANVTMHKQQAKPVHVVDLDPYGSAVPFLDAAINSVCDGGLLLVTCTDLAVLAGNGHIEKCFSHYGGTTVRTDATHESALRLVLNTVAQTAARYGKAITPLMSLSIDYYLRCFIQVRTAPVLVKENFGNSAIVYNCTGCQTTHLQPLGRVSELQPKKKKNKAAAEGAEGDKPAKTNGSKPHKYSYARGPPVGSHCEFCGNVHHLCGPLWSGPLHNQQFLDEMFKVLPELDGEVYGTKERMLGMLTLAKQEIETPFYVSPASMSFRVHSPVPPLKSFVSAILNGGYRASLTHAQPGCIKTDAPPDFLWDVLRVWAKQNSANKDHKDSPGSRILAKETTHEVSFELNEGAEAIEKLRKSKIVCFQMNPRAEWGPMAKPKKDAEAAAEIEPKTEAAVETEK